MQRKMHKTGILSYGCLCFFLCEGVEMNQIINSNVEG